MQRIRIKDDALICAGQYGTLIGRINIADWVLVDLDEPAIFPNRNSTAFHEWEIEYV